MDEFSIRLALECITPLHLRRAHPHAFLIGNEEMLEFGLTVSPHCGLIADAWHWHHGGSDPDWLRGIPPDRILDVHISDSPAAPAEEIRDTERVLPGDGVIDFRLFFDLLREKSYPGMLSVEIFGSVLNGLNSAEAARRAFQASQAMLSGLGLAATARHPKEA
jgi:sugar phosphate isomerase/epimerase